MSPELYVSLIVALLGVLGGGGIWTYRQSRKEAPIRVEEAEIAAADKTVQMALAVATAARDAQIQLGKDLDKERTAREMLAGQFKALETHVREQDRTISGLREVVRAFSSAWDDLSVHWDTVRQRDRPPPKPQTYNP